jgi:hypothetical protein
LKLPRDITGTELAKALAEPGYHAARQTGSHIPDNLLIIGILAATLTDIEMHFKLTRHELLKCLFS